MRILLVLILTLILPLGPVAARDLPNGTYAVLGDVLPGIKQGYIVPVYLHVTISPGRLDWTFVTIGATVPIYCNTHQRCQTDLQSLSHHVDWDEDGILTVRQTERRTGDGLAIDRASLDDAHIFAPIQNLVEGGRLSFRGAGGRLTNPNHPGEARLIRASPPELREAVDLVKSFNQPMVQFDQCGVAQILTIQNMANRSDDQQQVLDAARFLGQMKRIEAKRHTYREATTDPDIIAEIEYLTSHYAAYQFALTFAQQEEEAALMAGHSYSDEILIAIAKDAAAPMTKLLDEEDVAELFETWRTELLAAQRYFARYAVAASKSENPISLICRNITLKPPEAPPG